MAEDGMMRASDADRDAAVSVLRDAYTAGRLTLEEFDERTSAAYAGRTWGELRELTSDLPGRLPLGADVPATATLNPAPPRNQADLPPGAPLRPRRPAGAFIPFVVIWFLVLLGTHPGGAAAAAVVMLILTLFFTAVSRRK